MLDAGLGVSAVVPHGQDSRDLHHVARHRGGPWVRRARLGAFAAPACGANFRRSARFCSRIACGLAQPAKPRIGHLERGSWLASRSSFFDGLAHLRALRYGGHPSPATMSERFGGPEQRELEPRCPMATAPSRAEDRRLNSFSDIQKASTDPSLPCRGPPLGV